MEKILNRRVYVEKELKAAQEQLKKAQDAQEEAKAALEQANSDKAAVQKELDTTKVNFKAAQETVAQKALAQAQEALKNTQAEAKRDLEAVNAQKAQLENQLTAAETAKTEAEQKKADFAEARVSGVVADVNTMNAHISWNKGYGAPDGYVVYYSTKLKTGVRTTDTSIDQAVALKKGTKYYLRVAAYKTIGDETVYSTQSAAAKPVCAASTVTKVKVSATTKKTTVTWNPSNGMPDSYRVFYATSATGKFKSIGSTTTTSKSKKLSLKKGKTYYFKVRGYKQVGDTTVKTSYSKVVKATVK